MDFNWFIRPKEAESSVNHGKKLRNNPIYIVESHKVQELSSMLPGGRNEDEV